MSYNSNEKWLTSGLVRANKLGFWHTVVAAESGNDIIYDYSGNDRPIETANASEIPNNPVVQSNIINNESAVYFDGTNSPFAYVSSDETLYHVFILAKYDGATFVGSDGLLSSAFGDGALLLGKGAAGTEFFDLGYDVAGYTYRKNDILYAESAQAAPMNAFALMEMKFPAGGFFSGYQVGRDREDGTRRWKGWFADAMAFDVALTAGERAGAILYYRLKYNLTDIPLFFPTPDILPVHGSAFYSEFHRQTDDWEAVTVSHTYYDGGRSFNETGDTPIKRWTLKMMGVPREQADIYDAFFAAARLTNTFNFTDKFGTVHDAVRIDNYKRTHDAHKSWVFNCEFTLVRYP